MDLELLNNNKIRVVDSINTTLGLLSHCIEIEDYKFLGKYTTTAKFIKFLYDNEYYANIYHYCRKIFKDSKEDIYYKDLFIVAGMNETCILPDCIKTIGIFAFENCRCIIETVVFNKDLEKISHRAFGNCFKLKTIKFSKKVTSSIKYIDEFAFYKCPNSIIRTMKDNFKKVYGI